MAWVTPVIDRQQSDIDNQTDKGFLSHTDLNRIEANTQYIQQQLIACGYSYGVENMTFKTDWTYSDLIIRSKADRIRNNIITLQNHCVTIMAEQGEVVYNNTFNFEQLNILEDNLLKLRQMIDRMLGYDIACGDVCCGGGI